MNFSKKQLHKIIFLNLVALPLLSTIAFADGPLPRMPSGPIPTIGSLRDAPLRAPTIGELSSAMRLYHLHNYAGALTIASDLANRGDGNAAALAGFIYEAGLVGQADNVKALDFYRRGVSANSSDAMIGLARLQADSANNIPESEARYALSKAIELGRDDAITMLAQILYASPTPQDQTRAFDLYKQAASKQDVFGAYGAAIMLDDDLPNPNDDPTLALPFLEQAANGGIAAAQSDLGLYYYFGKGTAKDLVKAAGWFKKSAENGDNDGEFYWALVNAKGEGTPRNFEIALQYSGLARANNPDAQRLYDQISHVIASHQAQPKTATPH